MQCSAVGLNLEVEPTEMISDKSDVANDAVFSNVSSQGFVDVLESSPSDIEKSHKGGVLHTASCRSTNSGLHMPEPHRCCHRGIHTHTHTHSHPHTLITM